MPFDGVALAAVVAETAPLLAGTRVDRIHQPHPRQLQLGFYGPGGGRRRLILSADPRYPTAHLTRRAPDNPPRPPAFCLLLRRHLEGARLVSLAQVGLDRILVLTFAARDELGDPVQLELVAELTGTRSNLVLVRAGVVVDAVTRLTGGRGISPGQAYLPPAPQGKLDPRDLDAATYLDLLATCPRGLELDRWLQRRLDGLSLTTARGLLAGAGPGAGPAAIAEACAAASARLKQGQFRPTLADTGEILDFAAIHLPQFPPSALTAFPDMGTLLDAYLARAEARQASQRLQHAVSLASDKARRKLAKQEDSLLDAARAAEYLAAAQGLLAVQRSVPPGADMARVPVYTAAGVGEVEVRLDPARSAAQNAQSYFKRYERAKSTLRAANRQAELTRAELGYLDRVEESIARAAGDSATLATVAAELAAEGYLKPERRPARQPAKALGPHRFMSPGGLTILAGRNNRQNDELLRSAPPGSYWFHARGLPGAHVILAVPAGSVPAEADLDAAAATAAYLSRGRQAAVVPVDMTPVGNVRKPAGARPGFVTYSGERLRHAVPALPASGLGALGLDEG